MLNKDLVLHILDSLNVRKQISEATGSDLKTRGELISKKRKVCKSKATEENLSEHKWHWVRIKQLNFISWGQHEKCVGLCLELKLEKNTCRWSVLKVWILFCDASQNAYSSLEVLCKAEVEGRTGAAISTLFFPSRLITGLMSLMRIDYISQDL